MKRFLKIVAILALFTVAIAYVAFRALFFDPFGGTRAELDPLIPPNVDVMIRRKALEKDFEVFPMPRFFSLLRIKDEWDALARTKIYKEIEPKLGIERLYAEAEKIPEQIRPLDLMADLAGREVMVVARWKKDGSLAFAAYVRGSFRAKFAAEAVKFSVVRKAQGDLIQGYEEKDGVRSLKVNGQTWHLFRVDDVLVAGNDFDLVHQIHDLSEGNGRSLLDSPLYRLAVPAKNDLGRTVDFVVDVGSAAKNLGIGWPPPPPRELLGMRFARELFDPARFGQAMGQLALGTQVELSVHAQADFSQLRPAAGGLLDGTTSDLAQMWKFCGTVFPSRVAVTGLVRLDIKQFLRRMEGLLDNDARSLLNDGISQLRSDDRVLQPKSTVELLDAFSAVVGNEFAFAIEPDRPYNVPGTGDQMQVPDPAWGPRVALVFPVGDRSQAEQFVDRLYKAISKRQGVVINAWTWSYDSELKQSFREVKFAAAIDLPTISFGFLKLMDRECLVVTTTGAFLDEIVKQQNAVAAGATTGLMTELQYKQAKDALTGFGHGFVFASGPNLREVIENLCPVFAENGTRPDWVRIRKAVEARISQQLFHGSGPQGDDEKHDLDARVDRDIEAQEKKWREATLPAATDALRRDVAGLAMLRFSTLSWRVNDRDLEFRLRLATPAMFADD
jgi:hypothetical protein